MFKKILKNTLVSLLIFGSIGIAYAAVMNMPSMTVGGEAVSTASTTDTFTNKTIDANGTGNSISNIETSDLSAATLVIESEGIGSNDNDTTLPSSAAVKDYVDNNGGGGNKALWLPAPAGGFSSGGSYTRNATHRAGAVQLPDAASTDFALSFIAPSDFSSLSSVHFYWSSSAASSNAYLSVESLGTASGETTGGDYDSIGATTYASASSAGGLNISDITAAVNGQSFNTGDLIGIQIQRQGGNASDTLDTTMDCYGILINYL